jgi:preprotein translocase subunit SecA
MIDKQLVLKTDYFLKSAFRWEEIVAWVHQNCGMELKPRDVRDMQYDQLVNYLRDRADRQAYDSIREQIDDSIPENVDPREQNWQALSKWVNSNYGMNTNERELKKIGFLTEGDPSSLDTGKLHEYLYQRALESIERFDFSPLELRLDEKWGRQSLCEWLNQQYGIQMQPEQFQALIPEEATVLIKKEIDQLYHRKEIELPVYVGLSHFMPEHNGVARYNRESLADWSNRRFGTNLTLEQIESKSKPDITQMLLETSAQHMARGEQAAKRLEELLDAACGTRSAGGHAHNGVKSSATQERLTNLSAAKELAEWAREEYGLDLSPDGLMHLDRNSIEREIHNSFEHKYRYEIHTGERSISLETLDTAWKDHLYFMDQLKSGIGLVGYAQKDPKVEYRREGMRAFEQMWDRIASQVTGTIFRIAVVVPEPTVNRWQITSQVHESPVNDDIPDDHPALNHEGGGGQRPSQNEQAVEPIRNIGSRVGRNDPCPCGSGKKYKKCCGAN